MPATQRTETTTEDLSSEYSKDRTEALHGLKTITTSLAGVTVAAGILAFMWIGIDPRLTLMTEHASDMGERATSAWICAIVLAVAGGVMIGHRAGARMAGKVLDATGRGTPRVIHGVLLLVVFAGLTPILPLQATFVGILASVIVGQFEPRPEADAV